jgi:pimeloyl-ACP methyl ester carboxylesterase
MKAADEITTTGALAGLGREDPTPGPAPHFREAGAGPPVICLHSSTSYSGQWRALMDRLENRFRVLAPDLYGYGKSPAWPGDRPMYLDDQVALLEPMLRAAEEPFHLVGHSLGGAVALKTALTYPGSVRSLTVFEPVLFSVLVEHDPDGPAAHEILSVRDDTVRFADSGDLDASAQRFLDYWVGEGTWAATPEERRPRLAAGMSAVRSEWHAAFFDPTPLAGFAAIDIPTLYLTGSKSKLSTLAIARLLTVVLPDVRVEEVEGVGHMAPITHPDRVNIVIEEFLQEMAPGARSTR